MNKNLKILLIVNYVWCFVEGMLGPFLAVYTQKIGGNILDISWAWAIYLAVAGFLYIVFGKLSDGKIGQSRLMILGYYLYAIFTFCYIFINAPWQLFLVQIGIAIAAALATPTWQALYSKYDSDQENHGASGWQWGLAGGGAQIIMAFAIILGGLIVNYLSFAWLFIIMGSFQIIGTTYCAVLLYHNSRK